MLGLILPRASLQQSWYWQLLTSSIFLTGTFVFNNCAHAQVTNDTTLGNESSIVTPNVVINGIPSDAQGQEPSVLRIDGGAIRGVNLFHSFSEFSVGEGQGVYFSNPPGTENILSRVTGNNPSNILGTLGVTGGNANLFLINPNGIIFGTNASLDVKGSFVATTANGVQFGNLGFFHATTPNVPSALTINPSAFLFNQIAAQPITNRSQTGLQVPNSQSFLLLGGDIQLDGGFLLARGGRIELGGLAAVGTVGLNVDGSNLRLSFPNDVVRANVSLTNESEARVTAAGGGSIAVNARNLEVLGGSILRAGIREGFGSVGSQAGDIDINVTGTVTVAGSDIYNTVQSQSVGNAGDINISAGLLSLTDGAQLNTSTFGQGNGGNVYVQAKDSVFLDSADIFSTVNTRAIGNGGDITIKAGSVSLTNGAQLNTSTLGQGNAGNVFVQTKGSVSLDSADIFSTVNTRAIGNGGDITIKAGSVSLTNGAQFNTNTFGQGNAGNVFVQAIDSVSLDSANIYNNVRTGAEGNGGDINIAARSLSLTNGAQIQAGIRGATATLDVRRGNAGNVNINVDDAVTIAGNNSGLKSAIFGYLDAGSTGKGGNINISAGSISLTDGAELTTSTFGQGNAGNVFVQARGLVSLNSANIFSTVGTGAVGNGGKVTIKAGLLSLANGAQLNTSTFGQGNAGNVFVQAKDSVSLINANILSSVRSGAEGKGGNIDINAASLSLRDGAQLLTSTREASTTQPAGQGDAGSVSIKVTGKVDIAGGIGDIRSGIRSVMETGTVGNGGNINIDSGFFSLRDGAQLNASTFGQEGNAGNINIKATGEVEIAGRKDTFFSAIFSGVETGTVGNGGNITVNSGSFSLRDGARLNASTSGQGNAGNVTVRATGKVSFFNSVVINSVATSGVGNGGSVNIQGGEVSLNRAVFATSPLGKGNSGNIQINADDSAVISGSVLSSATFGQDNGGNITIDAGSFSLQDGAQLITSTFGQGNAGNVFVQAKDSVSLDSGSILSNVTTGAEGNGGDITIKAGSVSLTNDAELTASTFGQGDAGNVTVRAKDAVSLDNAYIVSTVEAGGVGKGGNIDINAATLSLRDGAQLLTSTREASTTQPAGQGDAGSVSIKVTGEVDIAGGRDHIRSGIRSLMETGTVGNGGNINIDSGSFSLRDGAQLTALTSGKGDAGNVTVRATSKASFSNSGVFTGIAVSGVGNGGRVSIEAQEVSLNGAIVGTSSLGTGNSGNIQINAKAGSLSLNNGAQLFTNTLRQGDAGNVSLHARDAIAFDGTNSEDITGVVSIVNSEAIGKGGNINVSASSFSLTNGAELFASTYGQGDAGNIQVNAFDFVSISGVNSLNGYSSGLFASTNTNSTGKGGDITVNTRALQISNGAVMDTITTSSKNGGHITVNANTFEAINGGQILTTAYNRGKAGDITVNVTDSITFSGSDPTFAARLAQFDNDRTIVTNASSVSGVFANTDSNATGNGGNIDFSTTNLNLINGAQISAQSQGKGKAGNITINARQTLNANDSDITTAASQSQGGAINITAREIRLSGDSDVTTNVFSGAGGGGNITLTANSIIAFDDSDILAFARDGRGGNITLNTPAFFGENYKPAPKGTDPRTLDGNNRVDINATGAIASGNISTPDTNSIQNSLSELSENLLNTNSLIANSCIVRSRKTGGTFIITGTGGLPYRPGDPSVSLYSTGTVRGVLGDRTSSNTPELNHSWKKGDPIVEPSGVYQLASGQLVLSRTCSQ